LGVDSGPRHIASAVNTPMVLLMPAHDQVHWWRPLDKIHQVLYHQVSCGPCFKSFCKIRKCMDLITIDEVIGAIEKQIKNIIKA
jgi:ADP-heptose:LPS heptosyltransferase